MQDVCDAYLFSQLPVSIPPLLSYLLILVSLYITIPSSFIIFDSVRILHQGLRVVNFVVTVLLVVYLSSDFRLDHNLAFSTNWISFFTMPVLGY